MWSVQCNVLCSMSTLQCTVRCSISTLQCTVLCNMSTLQFTVLCSMSSLQYTVLCSMLTLQCTVLRQVQNLDWVSEGSLVTTEGRGPVFIFKGWQCGYWFSSLRPSWKVSKILLVYIVWSSLRWLLAAASLRMWKRSIVLRWIPFFWNCTLRMTSCKSPKLVGVLLDVVQILKHVFCTGKNVCVH